MIKKSVFKIFIILAAFIAAANLYAEWLPDNGDGTFKNPPLYADYPDPSMIRVGNDFYLATSTFVNVPGLVICKSQDMVNWEIAGHCISSFPGGGVYDMIGGTRYGNGCFAPSIAYKDGVFYVVVTFNGERTRIYYADNVAGPWSYHQLNGGYFDPCLFIEDDNTPYLIWGGAWEDRIRMIQLNSNLSGTVGAERTILSYDNVEGAHLIKAKGTYYLFNAVPARSLVCSRSSSLWGPYGETTTLSNAGSGGHQGGIVDLPDGSYWGYLHQDDGAIGRMTRICPVTWENGWPRFGRPGNLGRVEASYTKPIPNKPVKVPAASDEFNGTSLGLQWMWNHNPDNSKWSLTGSALRLRATAASGFWQARNSLTQKGQGPTSSGSIKVDTGAMQAGDIGGLGILGDPHAYIAVATNPRRIIMSLEDNIQATVSNVTASILYFRVEMNFSTKQAKFLWKDDSRNWAQVGPAVTMGFDWQYGTFQGEQYAVLCFNPSGSSGYIDVDWFRLDDKPGGVTPNPTPTPPVEGNILVRARGISGGEILELRIDGNSITSWVMSTGYQDFIADGEGNVELHFTNDTAGSGLDIQVDYITYNNILYQAEDQEINTAVYQDSSCGGSYSEMMHCNGYILFPTNTIITPTPPPGTTGDVNNDGMINILDALMTAQYSVGLDPAGFYPANADVNCDGIINILDALMVAQYSVGLITAFLC